jgi:hypothetical protein
MEPFFPRAITTISRLGGVDFAPTSSTTRFPPAGGRTRPPRGQTQLRAGDHGRSRARPAPGTTGGWPTDAQVISEDPTERFQGTDATEPLVLSNRGYQFMLDESEARRSGISAEQVATFLRDYRIGDNIPDGQDVPSGFAERLDERIYLTALTPAVQEGSAVRACTEVIEPTAFRSRQQSSIVQGWARSNRCCQQTIPNRSRPRSRASAVGPVPPRPAPPTAAPDSSQRIPPRL